MTKTDRLTNKAILALVILIFIIFPLGQLAKLPLGLKNISVYLYDPVIVVLDIILIWQFVKNKQRFFLPSWRFDVSRHRSKSEQRVLFAVANWRQQPLFYQLIVYFSAIALFSWLINLRRWGLGDSLPGLLYWLRWTAYAGVFFTAQKLARVYKANWQETLNKLIIASALAIAILGLIQYLWIPDLTFMKYFGWDDHYYRLSAPYFDPGFTGILLVISILFFMSRIRRKNFAYYLLLSIQLAALFLTYSRSSYLALLFGLFILFRAKKKLIYFVGATALVSAIIFLLPRPGGEGVKLLRTSTISARAQNYQQSLLIIKKDPFLGIGFNNLRLVKNNQSHSGGGVDNSFLFTTGVSGLAGLIIFSLIWLVPLASSKTALLAVPLIVHAQFHNTLFYSWIIIWWWIVFGSIFKCDR